MASTTFGRKGPRALRECVVTCVWFVLVAVSDSNPLMTSNQTAQMTSAATQAAAALSDSMSMMNSVCRAIPKVSLIVPHFFLKTIDARTLDIKDRRGETVGHAPALARYARHPPTMRTSDVFDTMFFDNEASIRQWGRQCHNGKIITNFTAERGTDKETLRVIVACADDGGVNDLAFQNSQLAGIFSSESFGRFDLYCGCYVMLNDASVGALVYCTRCDVDAPWQRRPSATQSHVVGAFVSLMQSFNWKSATNAFFAAYSSVSAENVGGRNPHSDLHDCSATTLSLDAQSQAAVRVFAQVGAYVGNFRRLSLLLQYMTALHTEVKTQWRSYIDTRLAPMLMATTRPTTHIRTHHASNAARLVVAESLRDLFRQIYLRQRAESASEWYHLRAVANDLDLFLDDLKHPSAHTIARVVLEMVRMALGGDTGATASESVDAVSSSPPSRSDTYTHELQRMSNGTYSSRAGFFILPESKVKVPLALSMAPRFFLLHKMSSIPPDAWAQLNEMHSAKHLTYEKLRTNFGHYLTVPANSTCMCHAFPAFLFFGSPTECMAASLLVSSDDRDLLPPRSFASNVSGLITHDDLHHLNMLFQTIDTALALEHFLENILDRHAWARFITPDGGRIEWTHDGLPLTAHVNFLVMGAFPRILDDDFIKPQTGKHQEPEKPQETTEETETAADSDVNADIALEDALPSSVAQSTQQVPIALELPDPMKSTPAPGTLAAVYSSVAPCVASRNYRKENAPSKIAYSWVFDDRTPNEMVAMQALNFNGKVNKYGIKIKW